VLNGESWSAWTNWVSTVFTTVGTIDLYSNGTTGGAFAYVDTFTPTDPAAVYTPATVDWNNSNVQEITLTANRSFTFNNGKNGGLYTLFINQDGTGGKTITWPANVKWAGGIAPTLTPTASAVDLIKFAYNGTNYLGNSITLDIK
ncbi:MAG: hypothetical protein HGB12_14280, partial [Bacteroidetes bacterium]|nr:hypothetical protein [Bacteroidota bacterium]